MGNQLNIKDFNKEDLLIEIKDGPNNSINIAFIGRIYMIDPSKVVSPYLEKLHQSILDNNIKNITVNFSNLHLLNSSGLKTIIKWFKLSDSVEGSKRYHIKLLYNDDVDWQDTSLAMLTELFPKIIEKEAI